MRLVSLTCPAYLTSLRARLSSSSLASRGSVLANPRMSAAICVAISVAACDASNPVRARAASDLSCPSNQVTVTATSDRSYKASGCGASATYVCVEERPLAIGQSLLVQALASETVCIRESVDKPQPHIVTVPFPSGFTFGSSLSTTKPICTDAEHWWQPREPAVFRCGGTPASVGYPATVDLAFCADRLCRIDVLIRAQDPNGWTGLHNEVRSKLEAHYGPRTNYASNIPPACAPVLASCLQGGGAQADTTWRWNTPHGVLLTIGRDGDGPVIRIRYDTSGLAAQPLL